jgi:hypothetical protein
MIKPTTRILAITLAAVVALAGAGCKKQAPAQSQMVTYGGVPVAINKLRQSLATASPEAQRLLGQVTFNLRYRRYDPVLAALDKLKQTPGLNDAQKQVIDEVTEQVKQAAKNQEAAASGAEPAK